MTRGLKKMTLIKRKELANNNPGPDGKDAARYTGGSPGYFSTDESLGNMKDQDMK